MAVFRLARRAMASQFEVLIEGGEEIRQRAAAEEALDEIERIEAQLSFYRPTSEVSRINARAARAPVRAEPRLFKLLQTARQAYEETGGAFDITVAPLMRCWGFVNDTGRLPDPADLEAARTVVGMHHVILDDGARTVSFAKPGVLIDLGAIGKGFAIDQAAILLKDAGVENALIHGGRSTIYAMGRAGDGEPWKVGIARPGANPDAPFTDDLMAVIALENESVSVSAVWGKAFEAAGKVYGHVLDPRRGAPVEGALLAACVLPSATLTDALSTALLIMGRQSQELITRCSANTKALVVLRSDGEHGYDTITTGVERLRHRDAVGAHIKM